MIQRITKLQGLIVTALMSVLVTSGVAFATEEARMSESHSSSEQRKVDNERENRLRRSVEERPTSVKARLEDAGLKRCQARENVTRGVIERTNERGQNQIDLVAKITERVEAFYLKSGRQLSNYDALVADVEAKKQEAQAAVDELKKADAPFACDGDNPKAAVDTFKSRLNRKVAAMKEYRAAVKALIAGVKTARKPTATNTEGGV